MVTEIDCDCFKRVYSYDYIGDTSILAGYISGIFGDRFFQGTLYLVQPEAWGTFVSRDLLTKPT
jgi:hypothetical protein